MNDERNPPPHLLPTHASVLVQVKQARQAWQKEGDAATAAPLYLRILQAVPDLLDELEQELADSLIAYTTTLSQQQRLWLMDNATQSLPSSKLLAYAHGRVGYEARQYVVALKAFRRALQLDPSFGAAREALESIKNLVLDRWHFRMLNDKTRNTAYQEALRCVVAEVAAKKKMQQEGQKDAAGPRVLDIGTGTGLLAWMALQAGAGQVLACETNPVLSAVARDLLSQVAPPNKATVVNKSSYDLQLTTTLGGGPVDIIVTELVDAGLLGEHILPVLRHARQHHFLRPGGRIIPHAARVHAVVIESEEIRRRSRLLSSAAVLWLGDSTNQHVSGLVAVDEAYTCEKLASLPHKPLTRPVQVLEVPLADDFPQEEVVVEVDLEVEGEGQADAVAMWFDLDLLPPTQTGERRCSISTGPERAQNAWDQGVYFLPPGHLLQRGKPCRLRVAVIEDQLSFALSTTGSFSSLLPPPTVTLTTPTIAVVAEMEMAQLNDMRRLEAYQKALVQIASTELISRVVEWSGDFSVLSLLLPDIASLAAVPCVVMTKSEESAMALRAWHEARQNPHASSLSIHHAAATDDVPAHVQAFLALQNHHQQQQQQQVSSAVPPPPPTTTTTTTTTTLLVHDLVETSGWLRQDALREVHLALQVLGQAPLQQLRLLPNSFSVLLRGYESSFLWQQNHVEPENVLGYPVEEASEGLGVSKFRELDLSSTQQEHRPLTEVHLGMRLDLCSLLLDDHDGDAHDDDVIGKARVCLPVTSAGTLHAVGFWFDLHLTESLSLSTGPLPLSSYRQAAALVEQPREVVVGQQVCVEIVCTLSRGVDIKISYLLDEWEGRRRGK